MRITRNKRTAGAPANTIVMADTYSLTPDKTNPRKPDTARLGLLRLSIAKLGFLMPVFADKATGLLLSGHQRQTVSKELKLAQIPVQYVDIKQDDIAGVNILFNRRLEINEPVATPFGWMPIGSIEVGDQVIGRDGQPYRVIERTEIERREMFRVIFDDGIEILADAEHLWTVEFTGKSQTKYIESGTFCTSDIQRMLHAENRRVSTPQIAPVDLPAKSLPLDPWLLGVLLGDGSLDAHGIRLHTSAPQDWAYKKLTRTLPGYHINIGAGDSKATTFGIAGSERGGVMHNPLLDTLRDLGLAGKRAHEKYVPSQFLWASAAQRLAVLQGLMDSDGSVGPKGVTPVFTTTSEQLAYDVVHLVQSLGGKAGCRCMRVGDGRWRTTYQVTVRLPAQFCVFTRPDRVAAFAGATPRLRRRIVDIKPAGEHEAVCISIDSDEHLYLARGFIPTHNCTNDFGAFDTGAAARDKLDIETVIAAAEELPDADPASPYAINCSDENIADILRPHADLFNDKAATQAQAILRMGIKIPAVVSYSGQVVNGIHRLFGAAGAGHTDWPVVRIPDNIASVATNFLNYLSMDFHVDDDFKRLIRHSAYRRPQNNRGALGKSYRFWANGERTLMDRDSYGTGFFTKFRSIHGNTLLDFGGGLCQSAPYLRTKDFDAYDFEPYRIDPEGDVGVPSPAYSKEQAKRFLHAIADPRLKFDSIFLSSVLNSVPFAEDRLVVLAIVHALCSRNTVVYGTCRDISDFNYEYGGIRKANYFTFDTEPGVRVGDVMRNPKIQKFHTQDEAKEMFQRFWKEIEFWPGGNVFYWRLKSPLGFRPDIVARAIETEFNMPYADGTTMGLVDEAKRAFGKRLGVTLR